MEWVEPIIKWLVLGSLLLGGFALQRGRSRKVGRTEEQLNQMEEGDRAQTRQMEEVQRASNRDLLDELQRVRDRENSK